MSEVNPVCEGSKVAMCQMFYLHERSESPFGGGQRSPCDRDQFFFFFYLSSGGGGGGLV